jgi:acyl carrier protein
MSLMTDPATAVLGAAHEVLSRHDRPHELNRQHTFDELQCDSLDRIALAAVVERMSGLSIPDHVLATARSLGELIDHISLACGTTS